MAFKTAIVLLILAVVFAGSLRKKSSRRRRTNLHIIICSFRKRKCSEKRSGCSLRKEKCVCGSRKGYRNPYRYTNKLECENARDMARGCLNEPCLNKGLCSPGTHMYRCNCLGTGFYGRKCELECPERNAYGVMILKFPRDCFKA